MRIVGLTHADSAVSYHRILLPMTFFPYSAGDSFMPVSDKQQLDVSILRNADIVLFNRQCPYDLSTLLEFKKEYGFKIVVDIDDYWILSANHILNDDYREHGTSANISTAIRAADLVTTTHEYLEEKIKRLNEKVVIVPNALPFGTGQFNEEVYDNKNILYSCGVTHFNDLRTLQGAFYACSEDKDIQQYKLCIAGRNKASKHTEYIWAKIENLAASYGNYKMWPDLKLSNYMTHYKHAAIALAPLEDNEFNKCKSYLKALEAGCKNIPLLAPAIHPYTEVPVIHCKTKHDWYFNLKELIKRPEIRVEKGKLLGDYVRQELNLEKINKIRKKAYTECLTI